MRIYWFVFVFVFVIYSVDGLTFKPFTYSSTRFVARPKSIQATYNPITRRSTVQTVKAADTYVPVRDADQRDGIRSTLSELAKEYGKEFVQESVEQALGMLIPDSSTGNLVDTLRWLRKQNVTLSQIKQAIRAGSTTSRMRVASTSTDVTSSPFPSTKPGGMSLQDLDVLLGLDELLVAYKTCNSISRPSCSVAMAMAVLFDDGTTSLARYEIGKQNPSGCFDQYEDWFDVLVPDCHCHHYFSNCTLACVECDVKTSCTVPSTSTMDSYYHRSSYLNRQCSDIPLNDLCAFRTNEDEVSFLSIITAGFAGTDITLQLFDVDYAGATLCNVADDLDLGPLEEELDSSWELSGGTTIFPHIWIPTLIYALYV